MKTLKLLIVALMIGAVGFTTGCSTKWQQDPLAEKSGVLENGQQKPDPSTGPKPIDSEAVKIDAVDSFSFKEEGADEFTIETRILLPDYKPTLTIDNLGDFPGATYDSNTGRFKWTPAKGTVKTGVTVKKVLSVHVNAIKSGGKPLFGSKMINISVDKIFSAPAVVSVTVPQNKMREGETMNISVKIRDNDANPADQKTWPSVQLTNVISGKSMMPFVNMAGISSQGAGMYNVMLKLDLTSAELTKDVTAYSFGVKAISQFNQVGNEERVDVNVLTSFSDLISTWQDREATVGDKIEYSFMVMDPKNETTITVASFANLPAGAMASCAKVSPSVRNCTLLWKTDATTVANNYAIVAKAEIRNTNNMDAVVKNQDIPMNIKIKPAPAPVAPPTPPTTEGGH